MALVQDRRKPKTGQYSIRAPSLATIEADQVLPGLASGPQKMGGLIESEISEEIEDLQGKITSFPNFFKGKIRYDVGRKRLIYSWRCYV